MEASTIKEILDQIDDLIAVLEEHEDELYIALEVAQQLRDEVEQTISDVDYDE